LRKPEPLRPHHLFGFLHDGGRKSGRPRCEGTRTAFRFFQDVQRHVQRPSKGKTPSTDDVPCSHVLVPDKDVPPSQYRRSLSSLEQSPRVIPCPVVHRRQHCFPACRPKKKRERSAGDPISTVTMVFIVFRLSFFFSEAVHSGS